MKRSVTSMILMDNTVQKGIVTSMGNEIIRKIHGLNTRLVKDEIPEESLVKLHQALTILRTI